MKLSGFAKDVFHVFMLKISHLIVVGSLWGCLLYNFGSLSVGIKVAVIMIWCHRTCSSSNIGVSQYSDCCVFLFLVFVEKNFMAGLTFPVKPVL